MTRLYAYALIDASISLDDVDDLHGLTLVPAPAGFAVVRPIAESRSLPGPTPENLRAQDALVRELAARADAILPLRFGTAFDSDAACRERLSRFSADQLRTAFDRVRGCEQMTLRAFQPPTASPAPAIAAPDEMGPGTAYLTRRAAALATPVPEALKPFRDAVAAFVRAELIASGQRAPLLGTIYHLIARGESPRYRITAAGVPPPPDATVRLTGPSPAYAFAKDALP